MDNTRTFDEDLANGICVEEKVAKLIIKNRGYERLEVPPACKGYDLEFRQDDKVTYKIEVKHDLMFSTTGNVAVEFRSRGKDSGISTSTADWWCYVLNEEFWFIKTSELIKLCNKSGRIVSGGDIVTLTSGERIRSSELFLIKGEQFKSVAAQIT